MFDLATHWNTLFTPPARLVYPGSWVRHIPMAFLLVELARPRTLVELGVHTGNSFCAFCQAVTHFQTPTLCYGVDTFAGDPQAGHYGDEVYENLRDYLHQTYPTIAELLRMSFDQAGASFAEGSVDLLHIDGLHTYEAARHDLDTWLPKLSDRAVVLIHDISVRQEDFGTWQVWEEVRELAPSYGLRHGHGIGIMAIGKNVPEPIPRLLDALHADPRMEQIFCAAGEYVDTLFRLTEQKIENARLAGQAANQDDHVRLLQTSLKEQDAIIHDLVRRTDDQALHIQDLEQSAAEQVQRIREQESDITVARNHLQNLKQTNALLRDQADDLRVHVRHLESRLEELNGLISADRKRLDEILTLSRLQKQCWSRRLTAPARLLRDWIGSLRKS